MISAEDRLRMKSEVSSILHILNEAKIKYAVWGSAACLYHGGQWLWKNQDYEILISDCFDGPLLRRAVDSITAQCSTSWAYDPHFDADAWFAEKGDPPPLRPIRRFKHTSHPNLGVLLIPSISSYIGSMHHFDLDNEEDDPVWIYPSLKNFVESCLKLWNHEKRNSVLLDLADLVSARRLGDRWAIDVGLEISRERHRTTMERPSEWEMWEEIVWMAMTNSDSQRAGARFAARRAENMALREVEAGNG